MTTMKNDHEPPQPQQRRTTSLTRRGIRCGWALPAWRRRSVGVDPLRGGLPDGVPKNVDFFLHYWARAVVTKHLTNKKNNDNKQRTRNTKQKCTIHTHHPQSNKTGQREGRGEEETKRLRRLIGRRLVCRKERGGNRAYKRGGKQVGRNRAHYSATQKDKHKIYS